MSSELRTRLVAEYQDEISPGVARTQQNVMRDFNALSAAVRGAAVFSAFRAFAHDAAENGEELLRMAKRTGQTVEEVSALKYATKQADIEFRTMANALGYLGRAMSAAQNSHSQQAKIFKSLGVVVKETSGELRRPIAVLQDVGRQLSQVNDIGTATAQAMTLFGRSGQELLPVLRNMEELQGDLSKAYQIGAVTTTKAALANAEADRRYKDLEVAAGKLKGALGTLTNQALGPFIGLMTEGTRALTASAKTFPQLTEAVKLSALAFMAFKAESYLNKFSMGLENLAKSTVVFAGSMKNMTWAMIQAANPPKVYTTALGTMGQEAAMASGRFAGLRTSLGGLRKSFDSIGPAVVTGALSIALYKLQQIEGEIQEIERHASDFNAQNVGLEFMKVDVEAALGWAAKGKDGAAQLAKTRDSIEKTLAGATQELGKLQRELSNGKDRNGLMLQIERQKAIIAEGKRGLDELANQGKVRLTDQQKAEIKGQYEEVAKIALEARRVFHNEEEKLEDEHQDKIREINARKFVSAAAKQEAIHAVEVAHTFKLQNLRDKAAKEEREKNEAQLQEGLQMEKVYLDEIARGTLDVYTLISRQYDQDVADFADALAAKKISQEQFNRLEAAAADKAERARKVQRDREVAEEQEAYRERIEAQWAELQEYSAGEKERIKLVADLRIQQIEYDSSIPDQLARAMQDVQRAMAEHKEAMANVGFAVLAGDADTLTASLLKLAMAWNRLQQAQTKQAKEQKKVSDETKATHKLAEIGKKVWGQMEGALQGAAVAALQSGEAMGPALQKALKATLQSIAVEEAVQALVETAKGFASLAIRDPDGARNHFTAAALAAAAASAAGAAGAAIPSVGGSAGNSESSNGPRDYTDQDIDRIRGKSQAQSGGGGSRSSSGDSGGPVTISVNYSVQAYDSRDVSQFFRSNAGAITQTVSTELMRNPALARRVGNATTRDI